MTKSWWVHTDELDDRQKTVFDAPIETSHLILGPPGCGKTNLLLLRATQLVRSEKPNILVLVFTRTLKEFLKTGAHQYAFSPDRIQTLNYWAQSFIASQGQKVVKISGFREQRESLVKQLKAIIAKDRLRHVYDAIVLDEAQDYSFDELEIFFQLGTVVFAAADQRQAIYTVEPSKKKGSRQNLTELFGDNVYQLKHHYRNGPKICTIADKFASVWTAFDPLLPTSNYNDTEFPSVVTVEKASDLDFQAGKAIHQLNSQLKAYPDEFLGVLCPTNEVLMRVWQHIASSTLAKHAFLESSEKGYAQFDLSRPICVCTVHAAKGLEFRAVHIVGTEQFKGSPQLRQLIYTGSTRAKSSLTYHYSDPLPPFIESAFTVLRPPVAVAKLDDLLKSK